MSCGKRGYQIWSDHSVLDARQCTKTFEMMHIACWQLRQCLPAATTPASCSNICPPAATSASPSNICLRLLRRSCISHTMRIATVIVSALSFSLLRLDFWQVGARAGLARACRRPHVRIHLRWRQGWSMMIVGTELFSTRQYTCGSGRINPGQLE